MSDTTTPRSVIEKAPEQHTLTLPQALQVAIAQHQAGKLEEAEALYQKILAADPRYADAHHLLGAILHQRGAQEEALAAVEKALSLNPGQSFYINTQGRIHLAMGRLDAAVADFELAVQLEPQNAKAYFNLAETLMLRGQYEVAAKTYHRALTLDPVYAAANVGYAQARRALGDLGGALPYFQLGAAMEPDNLRYGEFLAQSLHLLGHLHLAIQRYQELLEKHPESADCRLNLAACYSLVGKKAESIAEFERLLLQLPEHPTILDGLYEARRQACDWRDLHEMEETAMRVLRARIAAGVPTGFRGFTVLYLPTSAEEIRDNNRSLSAQIGAGLQDRLWSERPAHPRLRIGYLTADVKEHPTAHLILELFQLHNREQFEVYLYSWARDDKSRHRTLIKATAEHFVECYRLPDKEIAEQIARDEIDVLIDLMGHTADNRLGVLARRPAPVQLGYLGYPGCYGGLIDYLIADPVVIPEGAEGVETVEAVARLPHSYQINSHRRVPLGPVPSREAAGLPATGMVFCCMNNSYKLDPFVFDIWCRILQQTPGSVLWLLQGPDDMATHLQVAAREQGIAPERLCFGPRVDRQAHLTRLQCADIFLDTRHYNAHTTATDALWAGVPVLTVAGNTFSARVAASLLHAVGLPELVQSDWLAYEAAALRWAQQPEQLQELRQRLSELRANAPLFQTDRLVADLERLYQQVWSQHRQGAAAESFTLPAVAASA